MLNGVYGGTKAFVLAFSQSLHHELADKGVSLLYERIMHKETSDVWVARCRAQVAGVLDVLEQDRAARKTSYWFGDGINHADIAVTCALRFIGEAHPAVFDETH